MKDLTEYILDRVTKRASVEGFTECWEWNLFRNSDGYGYGRLPTGRRRNAMRASHRMAYEAFVGPIPEGLHIDHLCRNTSCCNPDHLEPVTQAENARRGVASRPRTYSTYRRPDGLWATALNVSMSPRRIRKVFTSLDRDVAIAKAEAYLIDNPVRTFEQGSTA